MRFACLCVVGVGEGVPGSLGGDCGHKKRRPWTSLDERVGEAEKLSHLINLYKE